MYLTHYKFNNQAETDTLAVLYLEFSIAVDTVPHNVLLRKLQTFVISEKFFYLIQFYRRDP